MPEPSKTTDIPPETTDKNKDKEKNKDKNEEKKKKKKKKKGGWFQRIPNDIIFSPRGAILITFALIMEVVDLLLWDLIFDAIGLPYLDQVFEIIIEIIFMILLWFIAEIPFTSMLIPFIIERIPEISDYLPTWLLRLLF